MRIAYVINDLGGGGAEKVALTAAHALAKRGHQTLLVALTGDTAYDVSTPVVRLGTTIPAGFPFTALAAIRLRRALNTAFGGLSADLVISALPGADRVVRQARLPNSWHWIHNTLSEQAKSLTSSRRTRKRIAQARRRYDGRTLIAVSNGVAKDLRDNIGCTAADIRVIYNPFDLSEIRRLATSQPTGLPDYPYVLHVGRYTRQKRHDVLLDAYKASGVPHRLVLLTAPHPALMAQIAERALGDRVEVAGFQKNPYPWYKHAAALILSSDFEGLPNVLIEAIACGTPVVSTDCPSGPSEILTGPLSGYLCAVGDVRGLGRLLQQVIAVPPVIDPTFVDRFSVARHVDAIEGLAAVRPQKADGHL